MRPARHTYEVPGVGRGELWLRGTRLAHHELWLLPPQASGGHARGAIRRRLQTSPTARGEPVREVASDGVGCEPADVAADLCRRFGAHLRGEPVGYGDVEIALEGATPLQHALAAALRSVPWGEVVTYGQLAALAGRPGAARAAGAFCAESSWTLVVPAHRVVAAVGIGGYGAAGIEAKRRLLALEGVEL